MQDHLSQLQPLANILLLGDFNLPDIYWDTLTSDSSTSDAFCDMVFELNLSQLITCPTHIHGNIPDLLTTNEGSISNINVQSSEFPHFPSDHFSISFTLILNSYPVSSKFISTAHPVYDYSKANFLSMKAHISNSSITHFLTLSDVNAVWTIIKSVISDAMTQFIPKFQFHSKQYPVWFTKELQHQLKRLHTLRRKHKHSPSAHNSACLHQAEEEFQLNAITAKSTYESTLINKYAPPSDPAIYHYIRAITKSGSIPPTVYLDNASASSDESKANLFNQYFYSVFTASYQEPNYVNSSSNSSQLDSLVFNEEEVYAALVQLDPNKATGIDKISPKVLKHCASSLFRPLCHLFNLSLSTGAIPTEWKVHLITPVYKSADRSSVKNYRPISLLCIASKVLEILTLMKKTSFNRPVTGLPMWLIESLCHACIWQMLTGNSIVAVLSDRIAAVLWFSWGNPVF